MALRREQIARVLRLCDSIFENVQPIGFSLRSVESSRNSVISPWARTNPADGTSDASWKLDDAQWEMGLLDTDRT